MKSRTPQFVMRMPEDYKRKLHELADERKVSMSELIRIWIDKDYK